jgi:hypothetical protein
MRKVIGLIVMAAGIVSGLLFFSAASKLNTSATDLTKLRSVGGTSIAEAYYQEMGQHGLAYSIISYACGLGIISVSLGLGGLLLAGDGARKEAVRETDVKAQSELPAQL